MTDPGIEYTDTGLDSTELAADPSAEEWERRADETAAALGQAVDALGDNVTGPAPRYGDFWSRVREINERLRTAPAIKLDDKLNLQHRINNICQQVRQSQRQAQERTRAEQEAVDDALRLAGDLLREANTIAEIQEVRQDLMLLRQRVAQLAPLLRRDDRQRLWEQWQAANQTAWAALSSHWEDNERRLGELLDAAERAVSAAQPREAKAHIKSFHSEARTLECSHAAVHTLRERAGRLWEDASRLAAEKHAAYLVALERRLTSWRGARDRLRMTRDRTQREIDALVRQSSIATTGVAAALLRGQIEERTKTLARIERELNDLEHRIGEAEASLAAP